MKTHNHLLAFPLAVALLGAPAATLLADDAVETEAPPPKALRQPPPMPQQLWTYRLHGGYQVVHFNGMTLYTYGDGRYFLPLSELRDVISLTPP